MEGFHYAVGDRRVRIFFILFHLTTTVSQAFNVMAKV